MMAGMEQDRIRVDGLELRVRRRGEGEPLLLITGIGANVEMWDPFVPLLPGRELIAYDVPGTGRSTRTWRPRTMREHARIAVGVLDALGIGRTDVLGYSWGGALAQELARRAPERVRRLVLCATSTGAISLPPKPAALLALSTPLRYYHPALAELITPWIAGGRTSRDAKILRDQARLRTLSPPSPLGYLFQTWAAGTWTSLPWLHRLTQPTLVIAGDDDPVIPLANARLLARLIPDAHLHVIRGAGHLFLLDEPENAMGPLCDFLTSPSHR